MSRGDQDLRWGRAGGLVERVRGELEVTGVATALVGATSTLAELRAVYEAVWGVQLDAANFRAERRRGERLGDPDRAPRSARVGRWQARGVVSSRAGVAARRTGSTSAANPGTDVNR